MVLVVEIQFWQARIQVNKRGQKGDSVKQQRKARNVCVVYLFGGGGDH